LNKAVASIKRTVVPVVKSENTLQRKLNQINCHRATCL